MDKDKRIQSLEFQSKARKGMYRRQRKVRELFERKFVDYRNELIRIRASLDEGDPTRDRITEFLKPDVTFYD